MRRPAFATVLLAILTATSALAANGPAWTAQGVVTRLKDNLITVQGRTCRLAGAPGRTAEQRFHVGDGARIACKDRVLVRIAVMPLPSIVSAPSKPTSTPAITVSGTITENDGMIIAIGTVMCLIDGTSPDASALVPGTRLSSMHCSGNPLTLTAFSVAS
jgi:hypothetical protein